MMTAFASLLAILPLPIIHKLGAILGSLFYLFDFKGKKTARQNINQTSLFTNPQARRHCLKVSYAELGKSLLESLALWTLPVYKIAPWVKQVTGRQYIELAHQQGQSIIFLTPHLGCFEIVSLYIGLTYPITVLYRPPKKNRMHAIMIEGRAKGKVRLASANTQGVRILMQALKRKEFIGILPDQIPAQGEGVWAPFFGKPAYTMTLACKLAEKTPSKVIMAFGERLPNGAGFHIHFTPVDSIATPNLMNKAITEQIAQNPTQYLWRYPRFKVRHFASPPDDTLRT